MASLHKRAELASDVELNGMEILTTTNEWKFEVQPWQSERRLPRIKLQPVQASHVTTFQVLDTKARPRDVKCGSSTSATVTSSSPPCLIVLLPLPVLLRLSLPRRLQWNSGRRIRGPRSISRYSNRHTPNQNADHQQEDRKEQRWRRPARKLHQSIITNLKGRFEGLRWRG